jgi:hypothetical protein
MDSNTYLSYYTKDTTNTNTDTYEQLKDKITNWCAKLYQDGIYSYKQYQSCLDKLDSGTIEFNKVNEQNNDENKNLERIYGYYKKDKEKLNIDTSNPNQPVVIDDFQKMTLYHSTKNKYLISDKNGFLSLSNVLTDFEQKEWQLISLGKKDESNVFAIMSKYGKFIVANDDGSVLANTTILSTWCQWKMIKYNNNFAFKSVIHKKFLAPVGEELLLVDGWSDTNLWVLRKKDVPSGKNMVKFDNSILLKKKEDLMNKYYTSYHNYLDYKYQSQYYFNKMDQLTTLRQNQLNYLLDIADQNKNALINPTQKSNVGNENNFSNASADCKLEKICIQNALEYSIQPSTPLSDDAANERINKIYDLKNNCNWNDNDVNRIIGYKYIEPESKYCNNSVNNNNNNDYNKKINDLELFKNDVQSMFDQLKETEYQDIYQLIENSNINMDNNYDEYKGAESELNAFIKNLSDEIDTTEKQIYNLVDSLDIKLDTNNQLLIKNHENEPPRSYDELSDIINSNFNIAKNNLKSQKNQTLYTILEIIVSIMIIVYFSYKSMKNYKFL